MPAPAVGVYVIAGQAAAVELTTTVRLQDVGLNVPVPLLPKVTVPVGAVGAVADVSLTVAVQLVAWLSATVVGMHDRTVFVACRALIWTVVLPLLVA